MSKRKYPKQLKPDDMWKIITKQIRGEIITHLNAIDYFWKNIKDVTKGQEALMTYCIRGQNFDHGMD